MNVVRSVLWSICAWFLLCSLLPAKVSAQKENDYLHFGLGYAVIGYPDDVEKAVKFLTDPPINAQHGLSIGLDWGVYWPLANNRTLLGPAATGFFDSYGKSGNYLSIIAAQLGFSVQHYFMADIGEGLFGRADIGLVDVEFRFTGGHGSSKTGYGVLVGGGYALPVSSSTRLTFQIYYAYRNTVDYIFNSAHIGVGMLL